MQGEREGELTLPPEYTGSAGGSRASHPEEGKHMALSVFSFSKGTLASWREQNLGTDVSAQLELSID